MLGSDGLFCSTALGSGSHPTVRSFSCYLVLSTGVKSFYFLFFAAFVSLAEKSLNFVGVGWGGGGGGEGSSLFRFSSSRMQDTIRPGV